ncbi:MAG: beta-glucosidase [Acidimicrobiia bacterium]|nr:beta-glucosidase [Acidimicrobiia bacterium]NNC75963.1 beta-glucosidase [Acidimicrobiia bacterium]
MRDEFTWGVATSAYQIEGGVAEDGRGETIWDRFTHTPGRVIDGATGDVACDHYHRWEEDVALMRELGVDGYRFSIAWARVLPEGTGDVNQAGVDFYDRLIDALLDAGITPYPTLYHWDLPQALEDGGGWRSRDTVGAFAEYADAITKRLGDRVSTWITHNEPWVAAFVGHLEGAHAPGLTDWGAALTAAHHLLVSHGEAAAVIRQNVPNSRVGIALDCRPSYPATDSAADAGAHRHFDGFRNRWFFDPVFGRGYPDDMVAAYRDRGRIGPGTPEFIQPGDMDLIGAPIDFLGINYYTSLPISAGADETEDTGIMPGVTVPDGFTEMGWPITPAALTGFLQRVHREYDPPSIFITENGASFSDGPGPEGTVDDQRRIDYLAAHVAAVAAAAESGVPVDGYFAWSLLDNLEWSLGFTQRFGLVWVDHDTGRRVPKASFDWYRERIAR